MRRIVIALGSTLTGLVLLFSWPTSLNRTAAAPGATGTSDATTGTADGATSDDATADGTTDGTTSSDGATSDGATSGDGSTSGEVASPDASTTDGTYDGAAASTRFGDVQVRITVANGVLTSAEAIAYPDEDRHDQQINAYAIPVLNDEAVAAQSAAIDMVSGATVTSRAYAQSLQDALDQAGL